VQKHVPVGERSLWALFLSLPIAYLLTSKLLPFIVVALFGVQTSVIELQATGTKSADSKGAEVWIERPQYMDGAVPSGWEARENRLVSYIPPYGPLTLEVPSTSPGLEFVKTDWSGHASIKIGASKSKVDLYSKSESRVSISGHELLLKSKGIFVPFVVVVFFTLLACMMLIIHRVLRVDGALLTVVDRPVGSKNLKYDSRLDHLRFLAAAMVIFYHCFTDNFGLGHSTYNPLLGLVEQGHMGVGLFMVLSGYLLTKIASGKEINYFDFIKNRVIRIYPLYILCVLIMLCGWSLNYSFAQALSLFFPFVNALQDVKLPMFAHLWTIAVEFQFYLIFPFLVLFLDKIGPRYIVGLLVLTIFFKYLMWTKMGSVTNVAYMTLLGRIDQFIIGMVAAFLTKQYLADSRITTAWLVAAVASAAVVMSIFCGQKGLIGIDQSWVMAFWPSIEAVMWATLIVSYSHARIRIPEAINVSLARLGQLSFSMYCMHYVVIPFTNSHFVRIGQAPGGLADVLAQTAFLTVPAIVIFSMLTYGIIEKPFFNLKKKYAMPSPAELSLLQQNERESVK
jgi:peptidoglycan/LPS O-acetylase OafA/YrhL